MDLSMRLSWPQAPISRKPSHQLSWSHWVELFKQPELAELRRELQLTLREAGA